MEKFVKKSLTLEEGQITKKQVTQIKEKVEFMYNKILQLKSENEERRKNERQT